MQAEPAADPAEHTADMAHQAEADGQASDKDIARLGGPGRGELGAWLRQAHTPSSHKLPWGSRRGPRHKEFNKLDMLRTWQSNEETEQP